MMNNTTHATIIHKAFHFFFMRYASYSEINLVWLILLYQNLPYLQENNIKDYGYDCGASQVEKNIYADLREDNDDIVAFEKQYPNLISKLLFEARCAKEGVYFHPDTRYKKTINFEDIVDDEEFEDT